MTLIQIIKILEGIHGGEVTAIKFSHNKMKIFYQINFGPEQEIDAARG
jgi:hypothetical protein